MRRATLLALVFALLATFGALSCSSEAPAPVAGSGEMAVSLFLGDDGLAVLDVEEVDDEWETSPAPSSDAEAALRWELYDRAGALLAKGAVADARIVRSELDETGSFAPITATTSWMLLDLTLPSSGGELSLFEGASAAGGTTRQPLAGAKGGLAGKAQVPALHDGKGKVVESSGAAMGETVKIVDRGDCRTPLGILIVPDGYRAAEMEEFHADAERLTAALLESDLYSQHAAAITVWRQDIASAESGAGDPLTGVFPDTAFRSAYGEGDLRRCIFPKGKLSARTAKTLKEARKASRANVVVVLVNADEYAGCAGFKANVNLVAQATLSESHPLFELVSDHTLAHELGHAVFGLADEYDEGTCDHERGGPNVSHHLDDVPWKNMLTVAESELPTDASDPPGTVGAFVGAQYCMEGAWRPQLDCKMRSLPAPFCEVCRSHARDVIDRRWDKLRERGKKTCSPKNPKPGIGGIGGGLSAPSGSATASCLGPGACADCIATSCNAPTAACLGPGWYGGDLGGPCGPYMECFCTCSGDAAACSAECAALGSDECTSCLAGGHSECIQKSCAAVCG